MEPRKSNRLVQLVFVLLMAAVNSTQGMVSLGGISVYTYLPLTMVMAGLGLLVFLAAPDFPRVCALWKPLAVLLVPVVFPVLWSHLIWIAGQAGFSEIRRGYASMLYLFFGFCGAAAFTYAVGERAAWWYLATLVFANMGMVVRVVRAAGPAAFLRDFFYLMITFASVTGRWMHALEIHGITYALGVYVILFLMDPRSARKAWPLTVLTVFCFLVGLKRIAFAAALGAAAEGILFRTLDRFPQLKGFLLRTMAGGFLVAGLVYVGAVYFGLFEFLERIGIDTNVRVSIYQSYYKYFEFSPTFLGNGTGWVDDLFQKMSRVRETFYHTHNDYLRVFIELGMFGFVIWCYTKCVLPVLYGYRELEGWGGDLCLAMISYLAITCTVDSTSTQIYVNMAYGVILMCHGLSVRERKMAGKLAEGNRRRSERGG